MILRKAVAADVAALFSLEQELFSQENYPLSRASFYYHIRYNLLLVAEVSGKIVGYALVLIRRKSAKLYSLGVAKEHQGKKIAHSLMQELKKRTVELGFQRMVLEVRTDNKTAIDFYVKHGFGVRKRSRAFYRDGCDAFIMEIDYA